MQISKSKTSTVWYNIYNFGRGFATSLPLLLVKQVVTPPSGEETMCQCLEIRCTCRATPIITALILVMVMASVLGQLRPPVVGFLRRVVGVLPPSPVILLSWGILPLVLNPSVSFLATS